MFSSSLLMGCVLNFANNYSAIVSQRTSVPAAYRRASGSGSFVHNVVSINLFWKGE